MEIRSIITEYNADWFYSIDHDFWGGFVKGLWDWQKAAYGRFYNFYNPPFPYLFYFKSISNELMLNLDAWLYGFHRKLQIELEAFRKGKKLGITDYEACVSCGCYIDNYDVVCLEQSGNMRKQDCCHRFLQLCTNIFGVEPPKKCDKYNSQNPIGHCAEQHAINDLMTNLNKTASIKVSIAVRPRTMTYKDNCENCKAIMTKI